MEQLIVAVYDRQLNAYMRPFPVPAVGAAIRSFQDEVNRADSEMRKHPDDYDLWQLATWNEETGEFKNDRKQLAIGKMMLRQKEE